MTASLWLIPRDDNPFTTNTQELISDTVPSNFSHTLKKNNFIPHVTLTSDINPAKTYEGSGKSPQDWLDSLTLPEFKKESNEVVLELDHIEGSDAFYRKIAVEINEDKNLKKLAAFARREAVLGGGEANEEAAQKWAESDYAPHLSLFYSDLPLAEVKKKIPLVELQIGFNFGSLFDCCGGTLCMGGSLVLVDTSKPLEQWSIIARRETPWIMWKMSRNLA